MPNLKVTYKNFNKINLDNKLERFVGKPAYKVGFGKNGTRVLDFKFVSQKACNDIAKKLRGREEIVEALVELD